MTNDDLKILRQAVLRHLVYTNNPEWKDVNCLEENELINRGMSITIGSIARYNMDVKRLYRIIRSHQ